MHMEEPSKTSNWFPEDVWEGVLVALVVKKPPANAGDIRDAGSIPGLGRSLLSTPVFLPGESHRQRNLASYSPWACKESDMTETTELAHPQLAVPTFTSA